METGKELDKSQEIKQQNGVAIGNRDIAKTAIQSKFDE